MTREEAISEWTFRSNHIKKWLDEYGEEPSIRHYVELIDMAIEALSAEHEDYEHATLVDIKEPLKVSVVRCKDCRFYHNSEKYSYCNKINVKGRSPKQIDFCSYGERREK